MSTLHVHLVGHWISLQLEGELVFHFFNFCSITVL
jgi:hypothetical protein